MLKDNRDFENFVICFAHNGRNSGFFTQDDLWAEDKIDFIACPIDCYNFPSLVGNSHLRTSGFSGPLTPYYLAHYDKEFQVKG